MKVYIGPYANHIGSFYLAEKILFWKDKNKLNTDDPTDVHKDYDDIIKLSDILEKVPGLMKFCDWMNKLRSRKVRVRIDECDIWSADRTIAMVIVPLLKRMKDSKMGAPAIDDADVPNHLKSTSAPPLSEEDKNIGATDDNFFIRWDWVLDEIIWSFEQSANDWEDQYYSGTPDVNFEKIENGLSQLVYGPNNTFEVDREGIEKHRKRMENGRMLFAKYYECMWS